MAWKEVKKYSVNWRPEENKGYIVVYYETYGFGIWVDSVQELSFMVDLLRNEEPIYFNPDTKQLNTSLEEVGEGENKV
jgi:hypothetical protein